MDIYTPTDIAMHRQVWSWVGLVFYDEQRDRFGEIISRTKFNLSECSPFAFKSDTNIEIRIKRNVNVIFRLQ